jgi:exopolysaccharide biosynthesis polyprenyl glycosylphosphotransferase
LSLGQRYKILIAGDGVVSLLAVVLAFRLWADHLSEVFTWHSFLLPFLWCVLYPFVWILLAQGNNYYSLSITADFKRSFSRLTWIILELLVMALLACFFVPENQLSRRFILYYLLLSYLLMMFWRVCQLLLSSRAEFRRRALIAGTGAASQMLWETLTEVPRAYEVYGFVASLADPTAFSRNLPILGTALELPSLVQSKRITEVVIGYEHHVPNDVFEGLMACSELGVAITPMTKLYEEIKGAVPILFMEHLSWPLVLPTSDQTILFKGYLMLKRVTDILFSLLGLALFVFILPFLAIAIKLDSPGPVFYCQDRVGREGKIIRIVKLRSMIYGAEHLTGPRWAAAYDTRVTRLGRIMRKIRLDEVPQLLNVLLGHMSLVGPRPERPEFVTMLAKEIPFYTKRLLVKPGLTGWAQIHYPYGNSIEGAHQKLQYDLYYIRHQSLMQDTIILMRTLGTVLRFQGT